MNSSIDCLKLDKKNISEIPNLAMPYSDHKYITVTIEKNSIRKQKKFPDIR